MFSIIENNYNIKLDEIQKEVLSNLMDFLGNKNEKTICITGEAGTGKTTFIKWIVELNSKLTISVCAPTNKALQVLQNKLDESLCEFSTLHSFLALTPEINIIDFDVRSLTFTSNKPSFAYVAYNLVIIDECSMINDELYDTLVQIAIHNNLKLIFVGDSAQLAPVKQNKISKVFTEPKQLKLTKVYRQKESCVYSLIKQARKYPIYHFTSQSDETSNIVVCPNIKQMLKDYAHLFKFAADSKDLQFVKLITYTNKRVAALNDYIRNLIYTNNHEYNYGEILVGYDSIVQNGDVIIQNSNDYIVQTVTPSTYGNLAAYDLEVIDNQLRRLTFTVLSKNNKSEDFTNLANELERMRLKAVKFKSTIAFEQYNRFNNSFVTPIDLYTSDNRVIKRKTIDYGYCTTAHKSQSSEYQFVLVDMENLYRCTDIKLLRQLQYVAISRTKDNLIIYQKDE